jgi:tetratricopeptide (TPR) repeat protein
MTSRTPNARLLALYGEAGYTEHGQLGRDLERYSSTLRGGTVRVDDTTVSRWLMEGQQPRTLQVRRLIAGVLTGKLGRLVTVADLGWADPLGDIAGLGLPYAHSLPDTVEVLSNLVRSESLSDRRALMCAAAVSVSAFTAAAWRWMTADADPAVCTNAHSATAVEIRSMTGSLRTMGDAQGSGAVRPAAAGYLQHVLDRHLVAGSPVVEAETWSAAAELADLLAWLCSDAGLGSLAQRYEVQALRLSKAAGDTPLGGYILAAMSRQAMDNGGLREAVELSVAGLRMIDPSATPVLAAVLLTREARAHAQLAAAGLSGAADKARRSLDTAGQLLQDASELGELEPRAIGTFSQTVFPAQRAHVLHDLRAEKQAEPLALAALAKTPETEPVKRSLHECLLASIYLARGELDQALGAAEHALACASSVQSVRAADRVRGVADRLAPHARERRVKAFLCRVKEALPVT